LSQTLRERLWGFVAAGGSRRGAARHFGVSASTAVRVAASQAERDTLAPKKQGRPPGKGKLAPYVDFLVEIVEAVPDITLEELAAALEAEHGVRVHPSSISWVLIRAAVRLSGHLDPPPADIAARTVPPGRCLRYAVAATPRS
jgi:transposase